MAAVNSATFASLLQYKSVMAFLGIDCGAVCLPQVALTAEQRLRLRHDLDAIRFFRWGRGTE